jgi:hypothetical protein
MQASKQTNEWEHQVAVIGCIAAIRVIYMDMSDQAKTNRD